MTFNSMKRSSKFIYVILIILAFVTVGYILFPRLRSWAIEQSRISRIDQSIAVLPFKNLGNDSLKYFTNGLTEDIRNSLSRLPGLKVSAAGSSFKFDSSVVNLKEVAAKLQVGLILTGTVLLEGNRVKITAQLLNAKDSFRFWSETYNEPIENIFSIQNKIANATAGKLERTLLANDRQIIVKRPTERMDAYEFYLKGRESWNKRTPPELKKGIDYFNHAIAIDSLYAGAHAGLADCYTALGYGSFMAPEKTFPEAFKAARRALELDSTSAEAHATLGYYNFYYQWDWAAAEQEFRSAIALDSNYALGYDWYAYYLTAMKRYDEATIMLRKAYSLDPFSVAITTDMGFSAYYGGHYETATRELKTAVQMNSRFAMAQIWLGRTYEVQKDYLNAIVQYRKTLVALPNWPVAFAAIGHVYGEMGEKESARRILDTLTALSSKQFVTSYGVALVYTGMQEKDKAFEWLEKAYTEKSNWLVWLKSDPRWNSLRSDQRFKDLANRVLLPD